MIEHHPADPADPGDGREPDVLGSYLEFLRTRLGGERFEALVRAVQTACALLAEEHQVLLEVPGEGELTPDLRGEYLSLMAVMITGHLDHHLVELETPGGGKGWAVVENGRVRQQPPPAPQSTSPLGWDAEGRAWIDGQLDGIVRATDSTAP
ncbi:hypothetical protein J7E97_23135 [Streptomyces sp. ISL-66]|uniref:hypothetical protein n=1 Tax=Streptomyces sp. ISL-66 TaxID=2819186 RepID=UPI001BE56173|nr:hypothetical protein [Streptomyces sp. ISL-66]MBT2470683.1 hypothetical protein [Streptomyces sp. ISL-66]